MEAVTFGHPVRHHWGLFGSGTGRRDHKGEQMRVVEVFQAYNGLQGPLSNGSLMDGAL